MSPCILILVSLALISADSVTVLVSEGKLSGTLDDTTNVAKFFGIPFAAPPINELRWKPSQPPQPWSGIRDATNFGSACLQLPIAIIPAPDKLSEDCLFLNVWTRFPFAENSSRPVMLWLHGGGKSDDAGSGGDSIYDGTFFAQNHDTVLVTANYRLGPFGFLALPGLKKEDKLGATGTYALTDNQQALRWIRSNIHVFGGDPTRVTMFGVSAGGSLTLSHLVNPLSSGLFHRAIIQSGTGLRLGYGQLSLDEAYSNAQLLSSKVGCGDINSEIAVTCLRGLDAKTLLDATATSCYWVPVIDGVQVLGEPLDLVEAGKFNAMPTIVGCTKDEGSGDAIQSYGPFLSQSSYRAALGCWFGTENVESVNSFYRPENFSSPYWALETALGDWNLKCTTRKLASLISARSEYPVYTYVWSYSLLGGSDWNYLGAFHGSDVPFVFQTQTWTMSSDGVKFSTLVNGLWRQFAATGNPNSLDFNGWPAHTTTTDLNLNFGQDFSLTVQSAMGTGSRCNFWDKLDLGMQKAVCSPDWYYCRN